MEKLLEILHEIWDRIMPGVIVDCYEGGVLLRLGKYHKDLQPGLTWFIPIMYRAMTEIVVENSETLHIQRLTTADGHSVCITPVVSFNIRDVKKYLLDVEGRGTFLSDGVSSAVSKYVRTTKWEDLAKEENMKTLLTHIRRRSGRYGVEVLSVEFRDIVKVRALALVDKKW